MARNRPTFPELLDEGLEPYSVKELYLWAASETNFDVDITETFETKFEALRQHVSQFENFDEMAGRVRAFWSNDKGGYSERFRRIQLLF
jgi:LmbE family N-acetylglucosaminyl deacetylase